MKSEKSVTKSDMHRAMREQQLAWLEGVRLKSGLSLSALATRSGLTPTTLLRFASDEGRRGLLSPATTAAISRYLDQPNCGPLPCYSSQPGRIPEAKPYQPDPLNPLDTRIFEEWINDAHLSLWELSTTALMHVGYRPGDILVVDASSTATPGDIVCAKLYRWAPQKTELIFRIFEEPHYLVAASSDPTLRRPTIVDNDNTLILGVVVASVRLRRRADNRQE